jgi:hypothetical protein
MAVVLKVLPGQENHVQVRKLSLPGYTTNLYLSWHETGSAPTPTIGFMTKNGLGWPQHSLPSHPIPLLPAPTPQELINFNNGVQRVTQCTFKFFDKELFDFDENLFFNLTNDYLSLQKPIAEKLTLQQFYSCIAHYQR